MQIKTKVTSNIARSMDAYAKILPGIAKQTYEYFKQITPIDSGNARRNTSLRGLTIEANYPYASSLDEGHSKQAPEGMIEPAAAYMEDLIEKEINRLQKLKD